MFLNNGFQLFISIWDVWHDDSVYVSDFGKGNISNNYLLSDNSKNYIYLSLQRFTATEILKWVILYFVLFWICIYIYIYIYIKLFTTAKSRKVFYPTLPLQRRSPKMFRKKVVLKNFAKFTGNTCARVSF